MSRRTVPGFALCEKRSAAKPPNKPPSAAAQAIREKKRLPVRGSKRSLASDQKAEMRRAPKEAISR